VLWTGAAYGPPGLQARLLRLPPELAGQTWTRVVVAPLGGSIPSCLGHFLVLQSP